MRITGKKKRKKRKKKNTTSTNDDGVTEAITITGWARLKGFMHK
jgi:hypothetical protein